ncbi:MAG TPA: hypothetical protein VHE35_23965 [Kofleriaceae bacterium]|nr:hypothetical protein [Kofleriaceae bacterium]
MRAGVAASLALAALAAAARPAAAEPPQPWIAYGGLTLEAAVAGTFYLNFSDLADHMSEGTRLTLGTGGMVLLPIGAGYLAHRLDLEPRPALAIHGAFALGAEGFLIGALVDGRDEAWGVRAGRTSWTLGAIGAAAGAVIGGSDVDGRDEAAAWFVAPVAGFVVGGLGIGGVLAIAGGFDDDHLPGQLVTGATIGLAIGAGAATVLAVRGVGDTSPARRVAGVLLRHPPRLAFGPGRALVSVGGTF